MGYNEGHYERCWQPGGIGAEINADDLPDLRFSEDVTEERGRVYGHPYDDFSKVTGMAKALWGRGPETPEEHALYMVLVKLARLEATPGHPDSIRDIHGYMQTYKMILGREKRVEKSDRLGEIYRIEADCAIRDYDALEVDAGIMADALSAIAQKRNNKTFDPWAVEIARVALESVSDRVKGIVVNHDMEGGK